MKKYFLLSLLSLTIFSERTFSQDSTASAETPLRYHSVGFQVSFVSGIGIAYGINEKNSYRALFSGGLLSDNDKTYFSFGIDYQKELTKNQNFRVFIGPSAGTRGVTYEKPNLRIALGTGLEVPLTGSGIFQNITTGAVVYYPTFFFTSRSISFAGGIFLLYNF
jgi:hypothetical protein